MYDVSHLGRMITCYYRRLNVLKRFGKTLERPTHQLVGVVTKREISVGVNNTVTLGLIADKNDKVRKEKPKSSSKVAKQ